MTRVSPRFAAVDILSVGNDPLSVSVKGQVKLAAVDLSSVMHAWFRIQDVSQKSADHVSMKMETNSKLHVDGFRWSWPTVFGQEMSSERLFCITAMLTVSACLQSKTAWESFMQKALQVR